MAEEDEEGLESILEELAGRSFRRMARLDPSVWVTDEEYASGDIFLNSREKSDLPATLDSRITDATVENVDRNGVRFHVPIKVYEPLENVQANLELIEELMEQELLKRKGLDKNAIRDQRFGVADKKGQRPKKRKRRSNVARLCEKCYFRLYREVADQEVDEVEADKDLEEVVEEATEGLSAKTGQRGAKKKRIKMTWRRYWVVTPLMGEALPQSPRRPFFMIPKPILNWKYQIELVRKVSHPDELVEYQYTGCFDPGKPDTDLNAELVAFIRTDRWGPDPDQETIDREGPPEDPPAPLVRHEGKYKIPRKFEDERSITLRVHRDCAKLTQTAEQVFYWEQVVKNLEPIASEAEPQPLLTVTETGQVLGIEAATKQANKVRSDYEKWLDKHFDRWLPNECYSFREIYFDLWSAHDNSWASKANRQWAIMCLSVYVQSLPTVIYKTRSLDWTTFSCQIAPVENRRDVVRIFNHWKMTKSTLNSRASSDFDKATAKSARQNDHGGPWNGIEARYHWRFMTLLREAGTDPAKRLRLLGPVWSKRKPWQMMDHDGAFITRFAAKCINFVEGTGVIRGLSSKAGLGQFPTWEKLNEKELTDVRNYPEEYYWLLNDEYTTHDPIDAYKNQKGVIIFSTLDEVNIRLESASAYKNVPKMRLTYANASRFKDFIVHMWYWQPVAPIWESLLHKMEESEINHLFDTLSEIVKHTEGLPSAVVPHIQKVDEDWRPIWKVDASGQVVKRPDHFAFEFELDGDGDPVLKKDQQGKPIMATAQVSVPELLGKREDMEYMIWELRKRAIRWLRRRIAEKTFIGGARAFSGSAFGGLQDKSGFPNRIGDPDLSTYLTNEFGRQAWLSGVYDGLIGQAESTDMLFKTPDERLSAARSAIESRKMNIHYAWGKDPGKATHRRKVEWVNEWLYGLAGYRPSQGRKLAELIVSGNGKNWNEVENQAVKDHKTRVELEVIYEVFCTFNNIPLDVV